MQSGKLGGKIYGSVMVDTCSLAEKKETATEFTEINNFVAQTAHKASFALNLLYTPLALP